MAYRNRTEQALDAVAQFQQVHAEVWNLLPWYVNGTLEADERKQVERHLTQCLTCRTEVAEQAEIARCAAETDVIDSVMETSLAKMHERLAAEGAAVPPSGHVPNRAPRSRVADLWNRPRPVGGRSWRDWVHRILGYRPLAVGVMGGVPAMALVAFLMFGGAQTPVAPFTTLSDGEVTATGPVLRVKVEVDADASAFEALLAEQGLVVLSGPTPYGVYTLTFADADAAQAEEIVARLREADMVEFVTTVEP